MPFLIDGHNLIGHMPGMSLADPEDEAVLVQALAAFCRRTRSKAVVYFDRGAIDSGSGTAAGAVQVRFVRPPRTADDAIVEHVQSLRGEAANWTVVTSDRALRQAVRQAGARHQPSPEFARRLAPPAGRQDPAEKPPDPLPGEVQGWMDLFRRRKR
jgi:predicted RNA-binding protein with PIN domain